MKNLINSLFLGWHTKLLHFLFTAKFFSIKKTNYVAKHKLKKVITLDP